MNLMNDPAQNNGIAVLDRNGVVIPASRLPTYAWDQILFEFPGLMGGGSTDPYRDESYFDSNTAGGMNSTFGHRRGFYGEYLFDTPTQTSLRLVTSSNVPVSNRTVALFQKHLHTEIIDNTPELVGTTNEQGIVVLSNRPANDVTTITGHTRRANPFGDISVVGSNGTMLVRAASMETAAEDLYGWLLLVDLNLAFWAGNTDHATLDVKVVPLRP
jgi:hypothetical protein